jgi:hypothetical protein
VSDEFDELLEESPPFPPGDEAIPPESLQAPEPPSPLVTASSLLDPSDDQDQGDFEPGLYKGFEILHETEWPRVERHLHLRRRFYVRHNDAVGMVPWAGSMIIWQWDEAWEQGGYKTEVQSFLKEEKKETKKR